MAQLLGFPAAAAALVAVLVFAVSGTVDARGSATGAAHDAAGKAALARGPVHGCEADEGRTGRQVITLAAERTPARREYLLLAYGLAISIATATVLFAVFRERRNGSR